MSTVGPCQGGEGRREGQRAKGDDASLGIQPRFTARRVSVKDATLGLVNEKAQPRYRVFVSDIDAQIDNFSNRLTDGTATARIAGRFMGSGETEVMIALRPEVNGADLDLSTRIEATDVRRFNDMLRAHGGIDVTSGLFSGNRTQECHVKNGAVTGYVATSDLLFEGGRAAG